jgi:hypothetical protein
VHSQKHVNIGVEDVFYTKNNEKLTKIKRLESRKKTEKEKKIKQTDGDILAEKIQNKT